jgi:extensin-like protein
MSHCGFPTISRNYIGRTEWELRHRTAYDNCAHGIHGGRHREEFNAAFWRICGRWITYVHAYTPADYLVNWVGDVGVTVCKPGMHEQGRAFDLTHIRFTNGQRMDMNTDWDPNRSCSSRFATRQYIGVAAAARRQVGTVLTGWYNADHQNHIHFDNGTRVGPINRDLKTDTTLIQASCRYMNGESGLPIDGEWGDLTEAAYRRLRRKLRMQCRSPRRNTADALLFLHLIARTGLNGRAAGAYVGPC